MCQKQGKWAVCQSIFKPEAPVGCSQSTEVSIYQKWSKEGTMVSQGSLINTESEG